MRRRIAVLSIPLMIGAAIGSIALAGAASADHIASTVLTGPREVPGPGDPDGRGRAYVEVDLATNAVCASIKFRNVDPLSGAHIHEGATTEAGPVVVDFSGFIRTGSNVVKGCVVVDADLAQDILENEQDYYVNIHNAAYPDGAIRGQLGGQ